MRDKLGLCQWFHYQDQDSLHRAVELLRELGVRHLRTGISWADWHRPEGPAWYDAQMEALAEFDLLVSVWHTPPSLSRNGRCTGPPWRLRDYADFIDVLIGRYGEGIGALELWNEPNNKYKWDFAGSDPTWSAFSEMIRDAAHWARHCGTRTVLGGMIPVDPAWLELVGRGGALDDIDVVAFHAFPGMWYDDEPCWDQPHDWRGWEEKAARLAPVAGGRPLWVTETGRATCLPDGTPALYDAQVHALEQAAAASLERVYWYSLIDLHPDREAIEGFHVDEHEYHLGLVTADGRRKPAFDTMKALLRR